MIKAFYFWRKGLPSLISIFFIFVAVTGLFYLYLEHDLPDVTKLNTVRLQIPLRIYTEDGKLIQEYGEKRRIPVAYKDIPKQLIQALIATEDQRFFEHAGVDVMGLGRAGLRLLSTGTKSQGGSTITMQVARNFFLSRKKTFLRKLKEIMLAIKIDRTLSKEKILELYFNRVYLGNRAYGVGAAAAIYYGKPLNELTLAELAMIAGLPQAPSTQNPIVNPKAAKKRRDHVLERMLEAHYITQTEYEEAIQSPLTASFHGTPIEVPAPYVAEMIRQSLYTHFGSSAYTRGLNVYTTIKAPLQIAANESIRENLLAYDKRHGYRGPASHITLTSDMLKNPSASISSFPIVNGLEPVLITEVKQKKALGVNRRGKNITIPWEGMSSLRPALKKGWMGKLPNDAKQVVQVGDVVYIRELDGIIHITQVPDIEAALVALNPKNGAILALSGGFDFQKSKFNRATQSNRQPGSSFKPFLYAAALNKGYTLATLINDAPVVVETPGQPELWRPHNVNRAFSGPTRLREALTRSKNMVSIRILDDLGFDYVIDFVSQFGFQKKQLPRALSLALGTLSASPLEIAKAYAVFANGGYKVEPYLIASITDNEGHELLKASPETVGGGSDNTSESASAPRVISEDVAFLMYSALQDVIQHGTARAAKVLNRQDIAGKTGTTNDAVDTWFAGFTPNIVATTWAGFDNPQPIHEYGATLALPIWIDFMKKALKDEPEAFLPQPDNIVSARIDPLTGLLAKSNQTNALFEYFKTEDVPSEESPAEIGASGEPEPTNTAESLF